MPGASVVCPENKAKEGVKITCEPKAGTGFVELSNASSGEQLLATFLLMDMLATLSGFGILLLDDLDKLDEGSMEGLLQLLDSEEIRNSYHHIFIACVNHEDTLKALDKYKSKIQVFNI